MGQAIREFTVTLPRCLWVFLTFSSIECFCYSLGVFFSCHHLYLDSLNSLNSPATYFSIQSAGSARDKSPGAVYILHSYYMFTDKVNGFNAIAQMNSYEMSLYTQGLE